MREKDLQDYLYDHPEVLFPGAHVQEKAREYTIHGRRIDLLFVVDGVRHIVELKGVPLQRNHIGQVVEYYGLMKSYLSEANLRMILVAPSVPEWRGKYLEELGIRCVELPEVPADAKAADRVACNSRRSMRREATASERDASIQPADRLTWAEATSPANPKTFALARRFLRDSLEPIRTDFREYEVVPYGISRGHSLDFDVEYDEASANGSMVISRGGTWWAYRFGHSQEAPPNDVPNISVMANAGGLDVTINAELKPSQQILQNRIRRDPDRFNQIIRTHGDLRLKLFKKYEHQPRFYHWILSLCRPPGGFDAATILDAYRTSAGRFEAERAHWIERIVRNHRELSEGQIQHLERRNNSVNLATRIVHSFPASDSFWEAPYEQQLKSVVSAVAQLRPLLNFFTGGTG